MTTPETTDHPPADQIAVSAFRQIFHWPLSLAKPERPRDTINDIAAALGAKWEKVTARPDAYEEGVYFHDTVQQFLYPRESNERQTFARYDLKELCLTIGGKAHGFKVERLTLDLFAFGAAVVTLEIVANAPGTLAEVQTIIDHGRRAFPGFWSDDGMPGYCPSAARLMINGTQMDMPAPPREQMRKHWCDRGVPQLFPWWQEIAAPLVFEGQPNSDARPEWRHVLDERIPVMSFISLTNPALTDQAAYQQISKGDWFRIAGADQAGDDTMPYNANFLDAQAERLFYDRFHLDGKTTYTTRQCFAGYHYAMVGSGSDFFDTHAQTHFSSHYRQMNFIAHLEFATLLTFSRRISDLVRTKNGTGDEIAFRNAIHTLRTELLAFTHLYTFTDVSNHLQAREMNRMLRDAMGLEALRADVQAELAAASDFAQAAETREATASQIRLTEFASLFLPASLATGFGGMNLLAGLDRDEGVTLVIAPALAQFAVWVGLAYGVGALFLGLIDRKQRVFTWSWRISAGALALAALVWVWETRHGTPFWPDWPALRSGLVQNLDQTGGNGP